ncbi:Y-family DNA polymerase [Hymenobacter tibetensis]|uniref:Y-family DNA polymerase n=1 Tax=Hymenobacter tibetensis TaxID=497967 RepID=A0ABY4D488_9BACT|nr:Y-family DNA polymerase [Hymenobacter tibetensis]UOG76764.1 Y-family DNA polymerase [Hymenobacter tibetensis]
MFALVDCNNFYVSCERAFRPNLNTVPVVVLSNNDGCLISRSAEAKALGFGMGDAYFQVRPELEYNNVRVFSSNYALYGDMSRRVMHYLASVAPNIEIYSIDECFLDLHGMDRYLHPDLVKYATEVREQILRRTKIPTCVGIAPTKTLAKLANRIAKKIPKLNGVCYLNSPALIQRALEITEVGDIWGIGQQYANKLREQGIKTAAQLVKQSENWARKFLGGVVGVRLLRELQGKVCHQLQPSEDGTLSRQSITYSRTFGTPLTTFPDMVAAVSAFASRAAEKLRRQGSAANTISIFISKDRFSVEPPPYSFSTVVTLPVASSDTSELLRHVRSALKRLWKPGCVYKKAGVVLDGLEIAGQQQLDLFAKTNNGEVRDRLMADLDKLNEKFGSGAVTFASAFVKKGQRPAWDSRADFKSPAYTTSWEQLWTI